MTEKSLNTFCGYIEVINIQTITNDLFFLELRKPVEMEMPKPGTFAMLGCEMSRGTFLNRPVSFMNATSESIAFLIRKVGSGTVWLSNRMPGERVYLIGPLGKGFSVSCNWTCDSFVLVAGGTGIAPINFLAIALKESGIDYRVFWGCGERDELKLLNTCPGIEKPVSACEEDGLTVVSVVEDRLSAEKARTSNWRLCGPLGMMSSLTAVLEAWDVDLNAVEASVESIMACGFGSCMGCAIESSSIGYYHVCKDGPVFPIKDII